MGTLADLLKELRIGRSAPPPASTLPGGVLGAAVAWLLFNGYSVSTRGSNSSQVMFQFRVSPELAWNGM